MDRTFAERAQRIDSRHAAQWIQAARQKFLSPAQGRENGNSHRGLFQSCRSYPLESRNRYQDEWHKEGGERPVNGTASLKPPTCSPVGSTAESISTLTPITLAESKRLIELEKIILDGEHTFIKVGIALAEIRDARLYKADYKTFEAYCIGKWGWTKQHCYRLIECAPIAKSNPQVTSINQARELAKVPKEKRKTVIKAATTTAESAGRKLTAKDIQIAASPTLEPAPNYRHVFRSGMANKKSADHWWFCSATPEKRGKFFSMLLSWGKPVQVEDKKQFTERVNRWLAENVSEGPTL